MLLAASLLPVGLLSRFDQSPLVGYLKAGMLLGDPGSLNFVGSEEEIEAISESGVALLLFSLRLEFCIERLKKLGVRLLLGGVLPIVLVNIDRLVR